jgi:hypothetical protein
LLQPSHLYSSISYLNPCSVPHSLSGCGRFVDQSREMNDGTTTIHRNRRPPSPSRCFPANHVDRNRQGTEFCGTHPRNRPRTRGQAETRDCVWKDATFDVFKKWNGMICGQKENASRRQSKKQNALWKPFCGAGDHKCQAFSTNLFLTEPPKSGTGREIGLP